MEKITLNPNDKYSTIQLSNNNMTMNGNTSTGYGGVKSVRQSKKFDFYFEVKIDNLSSRILVGVSTPATDTSVSIGTSATKFPSTVKGLMNTGYTYSPETKVNTTFATNDVIGIAVSYTTNTLIFYKNGALAETIAGLIDDIWIPYLSSTTANDRATVAFIKRDFKYPIPTGFEAYQPPINKSLILHDGEYKKYKEKKEATNETYTNNLIPKMTSNTAPSGRAFASSTTSGSGYAPWKAFDEVPYEYHENGTPFEPYNLGYIFFNNEKKKVKAFSLTPAQSINMYKNFILQGSNDTVNGQDGTWVDIKEYVDISWSNSTLKTFILEHEVEYYAYRVYVKSTGRASYNTDEFKLYGILDHGAPEVLAGWEDISSVLPTQTQFISDGMDSLSPLLDRTVLKLEPVPMTDRSDILESGDIGKVFSKTVDLKRYFDIRSIKVEVK
ncbi:SPRY domain-containing protein [Lysinibacillus sp. NPDC048646]|uniref:SPRY domain-containing protein n=1 Tax=Lysinibacillus sp. NPDC048646 TaxID=3390574 RepID=UPI003CFC79A8